MRTPHTACARGQRVELVMKDGTRITDKFVARTGKNTDALEARISRDSIQSREVEHAWASARTTA
jgi:hypothetical protein